MFEDAHFRRTSTSKVRAPGWSVRNIKFGEGIGGKEVMAFTEVGIAIIPREREILIGLSVALKRGRCQNIRNRGDCACAGCKGTGTNTYAADTTNGEHETVVYVYSQLPGFTRPAGLKMSWSLDFLNTKRQGPERHTREKGAEVQRKNCAKDGKRRTRRRGDQ